MNLWIKVAEDSYFFPDELYTSLNRVRINAYQVDIFQVKLTKFEVT